MEALRAQYPEELLSARRASFLEQVTQSTVAHEEAPSSLQDHKVIDHLRNLGSLPVEYPPQLLAARRSTFTRRIAWLNFSTMVASAWQAIAKRIPVPAVHGRPPDRRAVPVTSTLIAASLSLAVFVGYLFYESQKLPSNSLHPQSGTFQSGRIMTASPRAVSITCKPGAEPPLCLAGEYKQEVGLADPGNGLARPAVAKDTMYAAGGIHKAAYVNDGLYGPGASWISNSRNSWIKIDLGKITEINTVTFGRDRLGNLNGHNPGQFVVALALTDNVYANGNNSKDNQEYQAVFNSKEAGFSGNISGDETVVAQFAPRAARYIKITFENKGTVIDEVEAFLKQPPAASNLSGTASRNRDKDETDSSPSASQSGGPISPPVSVTLPPVIPTTSVPTQTSIPKDTATAIATATNIPTNTPVSTSTAVPTSTVAPVNTPTAVPSNTPLPPPTGTPVPPDTATAVPTDALLTSVSPKTDITPNP